MYAAALAMNRGFLGGPQTGFTTRGLEGQTVGIVGLGHIGVRLAEMLQASRIKSLLYASAHHHSELEPRLGLTYATLPELLERSDVVFLSVSGGVGANFFGRAELDHMKSGSLLVSCMVSGVVNADDLFQALHLGKIRAASDYPMDDRFTTLPAGHWYSGVASSAFNTFAGLEETSSAAVNSLISLLVEGDDPARITLSTA
jgi:lactate dehydrogenase-like 2-hydroxyacid dehydrogenase